MSGNRKKEIPLTLFKEIVEQSTDGLMIMNAEGIVVYANKEYLRVSEREWDEMVGVHMNEFVREGSLEESLALLALREKRKVERPLMVRDKIPLAIISIPFFDSEGNVEWVVTKTRDITQLNDIKSNLDNLATLIKSYNRDGADSGIVAVSRQMRRIFELVDKIKDFDSTIVILGESGVGKDVVARRIHNRSIRKTKPFISINCSAIPEQILETELFGYIGGTFTGANRSGKKGIIEAAHGGTLFLDEVGDMPLSLQVKLLRVLETKTIVRVGDHQEIPVDIRIITATNKDLKAMVEQKKFREDLYYRLNVIKIPVPPLRERPEDIVPLCLVYLKKFNHQYNLNKSFSGEALDEFVLHSWPGNVRELKNVVERLIVISGDEIQKSDFMALVSDADGNGEFAQSDVVLRKIVPMAKAVSSVEKQLLQKAGAKYKTCREIAKALEVDYTTVSRKMHSYGLR